MGLFSSNKNDDFAIGDWVYIKPLGCGGTITDIIGDEVYVDIGDCEDEIYSKSDLRKF